MIATKANPTAGIILLAALRATALAVPMAAMVSVAAQAAGNESADDKRWLAVAPGRVEPVSGPIKLVAPVMGVIDKVLTSRVEIEGAMKRQGIK